MLAQAGQAVDLQHVEAPLPVQPHVDPGAIVDAQAFEGPLGDLDRLGGQCLADGRRAGVRDRSAASSGLVLVGVNGGRAFSEYQLHGREGFGRVVAQQADVDFSALDELLGQHGLVKLVEDHSGCIAQLFLVLDHLEAKGDRLVLGLDDHGVSQVGREGHVRSLQDRKVGSGHIVLAQDHLGDHLVQRQRVPQRTRGHVRDADHFQNAGNMGVARLPLQAVRDVEHHPGPLAVNHPRHEILQAVDQILVSLQGDHLVAPFAQGIGQPPDGLHADLLAVGHAEQVDDALAVAIVDDGDFHGSAPRSVGPAGSVSPLGRRGLIPHCPGRLSSTGRIRSRGALIPRSPGPG